MSLCIGALGRYKQPIDFLKLDYLKAYDRDLWIFLFHAIQGMGINEQFIGWIMNSW